MTIDPAVAPAGSPAKSKMNKGVYLIRSNPKWAEIQRHIVVGDLQAHEICERFNIRTEKGLLAIFAVIKYGEWMRERWKSCFDRMDEIESRAVRNEVLGIKREVVEKARASYDLAMSLTATKTVKGAGKGAKSHTEEVPTPDFIAAKEMLDVMMNASNGLGDAIGLNQENPVQVTQDNRVINLLALPKAIPPSSGSPPTPAGNQPSVRLIDVKKTA